jgi:hypothetical protein
MKTSSVVAALTLMLAATARNALGTNCTTDETNEITELYANVTTSAACADLASNAAITSLDYCQDADCLALLEDLVDQVPDCEDEDGINKQQGLASILVYCENVTTTLEASASASGSGSVGASGDSSGDSSTAGTPASSSNGSPANVLTALMLAVPVAAVAFFS